MDLEDWINVGALLAMVIGSCLFFGGLYIVFYVITLFFAAIPQMIVQIFKIMKGDIKWKTRKKKS